MLNGLGNFASFIKQAREMRGRMEEIQETLSRLQVEGSAGGGMVTVSGQVPLSELGNYQSQLKSVTGGEGSYSMEFSHYDPVPAPIQQTLMAEFKPSADED